jgi:hypothetical protein
VIEVDFIVPDEGWCWSGSYNRYVVDGKYVPEILE